MDTPIHVLLKDKEKTQFLLLRQSRNVIQDGAMRDHLSRLPRIEIWCQVQELFFRKAGIRLT